MSAVSCLDTDILIIGAGLAGAATAYHLRRLSSRDIVLLEKESTAGVHSSGRNASFVRENVEKAVLRDALSEGARILRTGSMAPYKQCGLMILGQGEQDVSQKFPAARGRGLWCPQDGVIDVAGLLQTYLAGQVVRYDTQVRHWERQHDRLSLSTNQGTMTCRQLINAAGPWVGVLGGLPVRPFNRHLFVTPPLDWVDAAWPFVWDVQHGLYFRPESGGLLLSCCDEGAAEPGCYDIDDNVVEELAHKLAAHQPGLGELAIQSMWVGQRVFAPDRLFVIGRDPREPSLFHVGGLGGHGVTSSPAVGKMAAELLLGHRDAAGNPFDPGRLLGG